MNKMVGRAKDLMETWDPEYRENRCRECALARTQHFDPVRRNLLPDLKHFLLQGCTRAT